MKNRDVYYPVGMDFKEGDEILKVVLDSELSHGCPECYYSDYGVRGCRGKIAPQCMHIERKTNDSVHFEEVR